MKSLITRFASIGTIFSFVLAGLTPAAAVAANTVRIHKGAEVSTYDVGRTDVLLKVTANCSLGANGTVTVNIEQLATESSNGTATISSTGTSPVRCNGQDQTVAVTVEGGVPGFNLGTATAEVTLARTPDISIQISDQPIVLLFPVLEHMEEEEGGNPEE
jgi:hypothetical protein